MSNNTNTGYWNTGDWNTGHGNTGHWNTGDWNTGDWNTGDRNSGYWNTGDWNTGFFNTDIPKVRIFNKETDIKRDDIDFPNYFYNVDITRWISEDDMTKEEKEENEGYTTTEGYLKTIDYKEAWKIAWDEADQEDREKTLTLPNWDNDIFKEITGIDVEKELNKKEDKCCHDNCKGYKFRHTLNSYMSLLILHEN